MRICVIIPTLNEAENLTSLLPYLKKEVIDEDLIVVADGGSTDDTESICNSYQVRYFASPRLGRGPQMNAAAAAFTEADIYYFMHADTRPPVGFVQDIVEAVGAGYPIGCYRFSFDSRHPLLAINAYFTRFKALACRGGDQSLFITKPAFNELNGFRDGMRIMEDYDIIKRAWEKFPFYIIPRNITVSARKYRANNYFRVQVANFIVFRMYLNGASQQDMIDRYRGLLKQ